MKNDQTPTSITLDALLKWAKGRAGPEEKQAIRADISSPDSRILSLFGDPDTVIRRIKSSEPQAIGNWRRSHRDHFMGYLTPEQIKATRNVDKIIEERLKDRPGNKVPREDDSGTPGR
jgi:hypothetical protein